MTSLRRDPPGPVPARVASDCRADRGLGGGAGLLAVALAAATSVAALGVVPSAGAAPAVELSRVVVSSVGTGAAGEDGGTGAAAADAGGVTRAADAVRAAGGRVLDELPLVAGVSAELPADAVLADGVAVVPDREVRLSSGSEVPAAGPSSTVRQTLGLGEPVEQGAGITVAVVDTGVAPHPDLAGRLTSVDVSGTGSGDGFGHGTFVAGVVAGDGASSQGRHAGVAPGAQVLDVRVAGPDGSTDLITVLRGLEVARQRGADVVNLSLSSYSPLPWQIDPLTVALTRLWQGGTVVVVPAGNDGPAPGSITSPGTAPALLTVGALDEAGSGDRDDDTVATFSARGPAPQGVAKPELVAPGRSVVSLRAAGSTIDRESPGGVADAHHFKGSGTSFSTAVTAGAAAVLLAERGAQSPDDVKALMVGTAYTTPALLDPAGAGAGGLDLAAALQADVPAAGPADPACPRKAQQSNKANRSCAAAPPASVPGTTGEWQQLARALADGDAARAERAWSRTSPDAQQWVSSSWAALPTDLRAALTADWEQAAWPGGTAEQWAARDWAARGWAAGAWTGRSWGSDDWAGRSWGGRSWGQGSQDGRSWGGRSWGGRSWGSEDWSGRSWGGRSWGGRSWGGRSWGGRSWGSDSWSGRSWGATAWGS
jgi:serine protease AprX